MVYLPVLVPNSLSLITCTDNRRQGPSLRLVVCPRERRSAPEQNENATLDQELIDYYFVSYNVVYGDVFSHLFRGWYGSFYARLKPMFVLVIAANS